MSLVPAVVATAAATSNAGDIGFWGHALLYIGATVLFGLIGMLPTMAEKDRQREALRAAKAQVKAEVAWSVENAPAQSAAPTDGYLVHEVPTIDVEFTEIRPAPQLPGGDPRWGR
jgi:hypothetical protein